MWLINLFFGAGPAPTGVLAESLAVALERHAFQVEVLTGRSSYNAGPGGTVAGQFGGRVHRLYSGPARVSGALGRLLSWLSFYLALAAFVFRRRLPEQVIVLTTPPLLHALLVLRNRFTARRTELILWNQDTYPEVLAAVGLLPPGSLRYRLLLAVERWAIARVRQVVALDQAMAGILRGHGASQVTIIPNWEMVSAPSDPGAADEPDQLINRARRTYRYLVLYAGNYGWGHNLTILCDYLRAHPDQREFFFLFVGGGEKWHELLELQKRIEGVAVAPYVPRARVPRLIESADLGLVALERSCLGLMSPSKIYGYLSRGKPLLYLGPEGSNVAEVIERFDCGFRVPEDDSEGLVRCLHRIADRQFDHAACVERARAAACHYTEHAAVDRFLQLLDAPARRRP